MADAVYYYQSPPKRKPGGWLYKLILYVSFVWAGIYPITTALISNFYTGFGNILYTSSSAFISVVPYALMMGLFSWISFEILFWLYRMILSFRIYSFVVPMASLKNISRTFYAIKNLLYGAVMLICFWHPYFYSFMPLVDVLLILALLICFALYIQKNFSEPIISHFVFRNFSYPIFVYECIVLFISVVGVLV